MGIIDSLGKGFQTVGRRWWVLAIPILLDAFLWLGPQASAQPVLQRAADMVLEAGALAQAGQDADEVTAAVREEFAALAERYNAFSALRVRALGVPSLLTWGGGGLSLPPVYEILWVYLLQAINVPDLVISVSRATFVTPTVWPIQSEVGWLSITVAASLLGIPIGSAYLIWLSASLDGSPTVPFWPRVLRLSGHLLLFAVLKIVALIVLGVPFLSLIYVFQALGADLLTFLVIFSALGALIWFSFYGIFFVASLVVNDTSLWQAIWNSLHVVLRNFWPTVGLFVLINLIGGGLTILWQQLSQGSWPTFLGIAGNAYVGTSLVASSLIFYQDRYTRWRESLASLLAGPKKTDA